jgi:hypothetical protein
VSRLNPVRVDVPKSARILQDLEEVAYSCAFEVNSPSPNNRAPEQWLRVIFEDAPAPFRWFVVAGWVVVLRLRLELRASSDHILGWRIVDRTSSAIVIGVEGPLLSARQVIQVDDDRLTHTTIVHHNRPAARVLWAVAAPLHLRAIPYLLHRATGKLNGSESH